MTPQHRVANEQPTNLVAKATNMMKVTAINRVEMVKTNSLMPKMTPQHRVANEQATNLVSKARNQKMERKCPP